MQPFILRLIGILLVLAAASVPAGTAPRSEPEPERCLLVSSYHPGYAWSDGVEQGLRAGLGDACSLRTLFMDSKRRKSEEQIRAAALRARETIEAWRPDVVIVADDNAVRHVLAAWYRDHALPFVFCGVNWTLEPYGLPYANATGMIEVAPARPLLEQALRSVPGARSLLYLGANTLTEEKNLDHFLRTARTLGLKADFRLVDRLEDWLAAYRLGQAYDLLVLGSSAGIAGWDDARALAAVRQPARALSVTNHGWMMPYAMLGFTKIPEEQGDWAAKVARKVLAGAAPSRFPVVTNRRWDVWINSGLLTTAGIELPDRLTRKAKKIAPDGR